MNNLTITASDPIISSGWVNEKQVATFIGCSLSKLRSDRFKHQGIPYSKVGKSVRYSLQDVESYMHHHRVMPGGGVNNV